MCEETVTHLYSPAERPKLATTSSEDGKLVLEHLQALEGMTVEELEADIAAMREMDSFHQSQRLVVPKQIVVDLAKGPSRFGRFACGVCEAFGKPWYRDKASWDLKSPLYRVFCYHEVPRIYCRFKDMEHFGKHANTIYERTIATYRAAGWTGEATEPNA